MSALQQQKAVLTAQVEHQETQSHSLQSALTFKEQDWQQVRLLACRGGGGFGNLDIGMDQYTGTPHTGCIHPRPHRAEWIQHPAGSQPF